MMSNISPLHRKEEPQQIRVTPQRASSSLRHLSCSSPTARLYPALATDAQTRGCRCLACAFYAGDPRIMMPLFTRQSRPDGDPWFAFRLSRARAHSVHQALARNAVALKDGRVAIDVDWIWELSGNLFDHLRPISSVPKQLEELGVGDANTSCHEFFSS